MSFKLDQLESNRQLATLSTAQLKELAEDIRLELVTTVARQGGHLASNLGDLELVLALHTVFDFTKDRLIFDTGHQSYVHKLLTGRRAAFQHLRDADGCCGFPLRSESEYDAFGAGHSGTAISAALGMAAARDSRGGEEKIVAVVGDGALGCGSSLEGLNNIAVTTKDFILVLNDNKMSIAPNVGAISKFLNHVISARSYNALRTRFSNFISSIPLIGARMRSRASRVEDALKSMFVKGNMFADLGLRYVGPVDGHDLPYMIALLKRLKRLKGPFIIHVLTHKGNGYQPAEEKPSTFHGISPFDVVTGQKLKALPDVTFSSAFGNTLKELRSADDSIVGVTAGMPDGTGMSDFAKVYPDSFFDVGIAEGHATAFSAGMSTVGKHPFFAVYASFSQRAFDYVFHDICLQKLPVVICLDRAGIVVDGPTHHGIQDIGFWCMLPSISVLQPSDASELSEMMRAARASNSPVVIRYPSGDASNLLEKHEVLSWGKAEVVHKGKSNIAIWAVGRELANAMKAAEFLEQEGIDATVVNTRFVKPFDAELMRSQLKSGMRIYTVEDHVIDGGFGSHARDVLSEYGENIVKFGWPVGKVGWGRLSDWRKKFDMSSDGIARRILSDCHDGALSEKNAK